MSAAGPRTPAPTPSTAGPQRRHVALGRRGWLIVAAALLVLSSRCVRLITGADDLDLRRHRRRRRSALAVPIGAGRPRRPLVRARRRGQHRPRGHDDPRHLGRRLGRLPVGAVGRRARRRRRAARSAACCTPSPPSPSASTTSSPVSRSTSSALRRHPVPVRAALRPACPAAARRSRRRSTRIADGHRARAVRRRCATLENKHWFLVSDLAGIARAACVTDVSLLTDHRRPAARR